VFWRVHRSHLVNINKIKEIVPWFSRNYILRMKDAKATEIPGQPVANEAAPGVPEAVSETPLEVALAPAPDELEGSIGVHRLQTSCETTEFVAPVPGFRSVGGLRLDNSATVIMHRLTSGRTRWWWFKTHARRPVYATLIVTCGFQVARVGRLEHGRRTLAGQDLPDRQQVAYRIGVPRRERYRDALLPAQPPTSRS
jgi:hypothetical protein